MSYLIGVDEAGYGPNLGPLCISASLWHLPVQNPSVNLYETLREVVENRPSDDRHKVVIADSKLIYSPDRGLEQLETNVLSIIASAGKVPTSFSELYEAIVDASCGRLDENVLDVEAAPNLPVSSDLEVIISLAERFRTALNARQIRFCGVKSLLVYPSRFNRLLDQHQNKAAVLSHLTLGLVNTMLADLPSGESRVVYCDKHGGRNRYNALLQTNFPDYLVEVHKESDEESIYRWGPARSRTEVRFSVRGERFLPSALSSMVSKYLRELAMMVFNRFWRHHLPDIRPTAGYPVDAKRFKREIADKQAELGISDEYLWRNR